MVAAMVVSVIRGVLQTQLHPSFAGNLDLQHSGISSWLFEVEVHNLLDGTISDWHLSLTSNHVVQFH